ncbi:MAG: GNAT family N-acetyltransferase [Leptolyngbya sp. SIO1D8]|nr:GNAT family N-acetyltransferase [Leptolyngbya sp. SIO1D8]
MPRSLLDKKGRRYTLSIVESDPLLVMQLHHQQLLVGEAKCLRASSSILLLKDIAIANEAIPKPNHDWVRLLQQILGWRPQTINYRGLGLGSALIRYLIHYAREERFQSLKGQVFRADLENNTKLLQWYQNHGFEIIRVDLTNNPDVVARLHLRIS